MRSILTALLFFTCIMSFASAGDTLVFPAHEDVVIKTNPGVGHTDYPEWVEFPSDGTPVYKLYAYLTFECAPGLRCGEWDYINYIRLGRTGGVNGQNLNWEIARYITPYGFYWDSGMNWKHGWYFDLTGFESLLRDSVEIIYRHTGYEANNDRGWKINLTFFAIEGDPPRDIVHIDRLWNGSFPYGNLSNPITNFLTDQSVTLQPGTDNATLKIIQSGHGMDQPQNCAEFCPKWRNVRFDGTSVHYRTIWKECGFNSLFPQAGTWLYDRTNWCPGEPVHPDDIHILGLTGGNTHNFGIQMEPYTSSGNTGNFVFSTFLIEYGQARYQHDVSLEMVMAPSRDYEHLRINPICGRPVVVIKNNGQQPLTSLTFEYGVPGHAKSTFQWSGNLPFLGLDTLELETPIIWGATNAGLDIELKSPNGQADEFPHNNRTWVPVDVPPVLPNDFIIFMFTNQAASENYYYIRDMETGLLVHEKNNFSNATFYRDTISGLQAAKCYRFEFYDDGPPPVSYPLNKDGLAWWANPNDGSGWLRLLNNMGGQVHQFHPDFGAKHYYQFTVDFPLATESANDVGTYLDIAPNPSSGLFQVGYYRHQVPVHLTVLNLNGQVVWSQGLTERGATVDVDLSHLPKGIYLLQLAGPDELEVKRIAVQ